MPPDVLPEEAYSPFRFPVVRLDFRVTRDDALFLGSNLQDAPADLYMNEINERADVLHSSACSHIPMTGQSYGDRLRREIEADETRIRHFYVDQNYIDNLDLELVAGVNFPENASAEFYGFYSIFTKFSAIWGTAVFALVDYFTGSSRNAIISLVLFFIIGLVLLSMVDVEKAKEAKKMELFSDV